MAVVLLSTLFGLAACGELSKSTSTESCVAACVTVEGVLGAEDACERDCRAHAGDCGRSVISSRQPYAACLERAVSGAR
jgi:hypothetical protein